MALISCPDCNKNISMRADFCPHCGCPAKYFSDAAASLNSAKMPQESSAQFDISGIKNYLLAFDREYQSLFLSQKHITGRILKRLHETYSPIARALRSGNEIMVNVDTTSINIFLKHYEALDEKALAHNDALTSSKVIENKEYLDTILSKIDPKIVLDEEQRRAIVTDDDYVLLVAGAGAGKTTTMAAKVKYLVDKCDVKPDDLIVVSYTNKAIDELKERINKKLGIPVEISTFHSFAFEIVRQQSDIGPMVCISPYNYIREALETAIYRNRNLMRNLVLFLGYYFDLTEDVFKFDNLEQYHFFRAQQDYESIKSNLGEYVIKVANKRQQGKSPRTIGGEFLRSIQEVQIANFLYLNGLDYEYEPVYPHKTASSKLYTPDFVISQGENIVYLEHFALSESGHNSMFSPEDILKYKNTIAKKRKLHEHYGTTLLETWSLYNDGRHVLKHLREMLENSGFVLKQRDLKEVYNKLVDTGKDKYIYKLIQFLITFITQYKTTGYDAGGFRVLREKTDNPRILLFLDIAEDVYNHYQERLQGNNQIDYQDMINDANKYLDEFEHQGVSLPFKHIIIDEFQDIARQRFNLTKRLSDITQAKVVAVGDDWQSIFAFAGSDITLFTRFIELMGSGMEMKITHTYRNSQELIDIAGGFIQKNSTQIRKRLISPKTLANPVILEEYDDSNKPFVNLSIAVENIIGKLLEEYGEHQNILLLGRYNFDGYKLYNTGQFECLSKDGDKIRCVKHPKAKLMFMTTHSSKGLGFDNVIILNMLEGKYGFPSQIENDPIMKLVTYEDNSIPFAEERRLFYVALTRTKNRVYIATPQNKPSRFLVELVKDYGIERSEKLNMDTVDHFSRRCPVCNFPLKYEFNKNYGLTLYLCTNEVEICDFMTNHPRFLYDIRKCNDGICDGYMIVEISKDLPFYGCTNFRSELKCRKTISIKTL